MWNAQSGKEIMTLKGHRYSPCSSAPFSLLCFSHFIHAPCFLDRSNVFSTDISPNGHVIVSASRDNSIKVWNAQTGAELRTLPGTQVWSFLLFIVPPIFFSCMFLCSLLFTLAHSLFPHTSHFFSLFFLLPSLASEWLFLLTLWIVICHCFR